MVASDLAEFSGVMESLDDQLRELQDDGELEEGSGGAAAEAKALNSREKIMSQEALAEDTYSDGSWEANVAQFGDLKEQRNIENDGSLGSSHDPSEIRTSDLGSLDLYGPRGAVSGRQASIRGSSGGSVTAAGENLTSGHGETFGSRTLDLQAQSTIALQMMMTKVMETFTEQNQALRSQQQQMVPTGMTAFSRIISVPSPLPEGSPFLAFAEKYAPGYSKWINQKYVEGPHRHQMNALSEESKRILRGSCTQPTKEGVREALGDTFDANSWTQENTNCLDKYFQKSTSTDFPMSAFTDQSFLGFLESQQVSSPFPLADDLRFEFAFGHDLMEHGSRASRGVLDNPLVKLLPTEIPSGMQSEVLALVKGQVQQIMNGHIPLSKALLEKAYLYEHYSNVIANIYICVAELFEDAKGSHGGSACAGATKFKMDLNASKERPFATVSRWILPDPLSMYLMVVTHARLYFGMDARRMFEALFRSDKTFEHKMVAELMESRMTLDEGAFVFSVRFQKLVSQCRQRSSPAPGENYGLPYSVVFSESVMTQVLREKLMLAEYSSPEDRIAVREYTVKFREKPLDFATFRQIDDMIRELNSKNLCQHGKQYNPARVTLSDRSSTSRIYVASAQASKFQKAVQFEQQKQKVQQSQPVQQKQAAAVNTQAVANTAKQGQLNKQVSAQAAAQVRTSSPAAPQRAQNASQGAQVSAAAPTGRPQQNTQPGSREVANKLLLSTDTFLEDAKLVHGIVKGKLGQEVIDAIMKPVTFRGVQTWKYQFIPENAAWFPVRDALKYPAVTKEEAATFDRWRVTSRFITAPFTGKSSQSTQGTVMVATSRTGTQEVLDRVQELRLQMARLSAQAEELTEVDHGGGSNGGGTTARSAGSGN